MTPIPFLSLAYQHEQIQTQVQEAITRVYTKNWFILGNELQSFEAEYAASIKVPYCLGVGNGFDALTISLRACNIGAGDEVIVPAHTYIATWLAISKTGARIVPVEPCENTFNIDVTKVEEVITKKTKVILPVHLYGQACDMTTLQELAQRYQLMIVEDNAQAHGAKWLEKFTGSYGAINATSFYPTKNLGALGDAGAITTYDQAKAAFASRYRNYGFAQKNVGWEEGVNSRLDELQAAVLRVKLAHLQTWNEQRRAIASHYLMALKNVGDIVLPLSDKEAHHVYHLFVIRTTYRDKLKAHLTDHGIETMIHYPVPPHLQHTYRHAGFKKGDFPVTERMAETILSLPLWPGITPDQVNYISDTIITFFN